MNDIIKEETGEGQKGNGKAVEILRILARSEVEISGLSPVCIDETRGLRWSKDDEDDRLPS